MERFVEKAKALSLEWAKIKTDLEEMKDAKGLIRSTNSSRHKSKSKKSLPRSTSFMEKIPRGASSTSSTPSISPLMFRRRSAHKLVWN